MICAYAFESTLKSAQSYAVGVHGADLRLQVVSCRSLISLRPVLLRGQKFSVGHMRELSGKALSLVLGHRHVDTARIYGNEEDVGMAVKVSGLPRDQVFVTTKLWSADYDDARAATVESLQRLGMEYVDLILLHSPGSSPQRRRAAWQTLEALQSEVENAS